MIGLNLHFVDLALPYFVDTCPFLCDLTKNKECVFVNNIRAVTKADLEVSF